MCLRFALHLCVAFLLPISTAEALRAAETPLGPTAVTFLGWSSDEREAAFVQTLPSVGEASPFRIAYVIDTETQGVIAHYRFQGSSHAALAPQAWRHARRYAEWQALSHKQHFARFGYSFSDSTVRLRPVKNAPLTVRAENTRLVFAAEAKSALDFEAVARLMDGSEASLGVFLQPCGENETLHGKLALFRSASGRHVLVLVDIWDAHARLVDRDVRMVALTPAPLGHIAIGLRRANNEIAREVRETFRALHPEAQQHWDHHIGPLF